MSKNYFLYRAYLTLASERLEYAIETHKNICNEIKKLEGLYRSGKGMEVDKLIYLTYKRKVFIKEAKMLVKIINNLERGLSL